MALRSRPLTLAAAVAFLLPAAAVAQDPPTRRFTVFAGPTMDGRDGFAFHVGTAFSAGGAGEFGARFDLGRTHHAPPRMVVGLCPQPPAPCRRAPMESGLDFYSATANVVYFDRRAGIGYWIAGIGAYAVARSEEGSYVRPGWNAGVGWWIGNAALVEVRYHSIASPAGLRAYLPIAVGLRF